jgi:hypothetical protein
MKTEAPHLIITNPVCTSQETHYISTTEHNRLMLCGETVAVCCENCTEHTDTLWAVCTSQETHHVSTTETSQLMLCGETVAVCYENHTEHTDTLCGQETYYALCLCCIAQPVIAAWGNTCSLL